MGAGECPEGRERRGDCDERRRGATSGARAAGSGFVWIRCPFLSGCVDALRCSSKVLRSSAVPAWQVWLAGVRSVLCAVGASCGCSPGATVVRPNIRLVTIDLPISRHLFFFALGPIQFGLAGLDRRELVGFAPRIRPTFEWLMGVCVGFISGLFRDRSPPGPVCEIARLRVRAVPFASPLCAAGVLPVCIWRAPGRSSGNAFDRGFSKLFGSCCLCRSAPLRGVRWRCARGSVLSLSSWSMALFAVGARGSTPWASGPDTHRRDMRTRLRIRHGRGSYSPAE